MSKELIQIEKKSEKGFVDNLKRVFFKTQVWLMAIHAEGNSSYKFVNFFSYFFLSTKGIHLCRKFFGALTGIKLSNTGVYDYNEWYHNHKPTDKELLQFRKQIQNFSLKPELHITLVVDNEILFDDLMKTASSIIKQVYTNWKLTIVVNSQHLKSRLLTYNGLADSRVEILIKENESDAFQLLNYGIESALAEYIVFVGIGNLVAEDAFFRMAQSLNEEKIELLYTDEDEIDKNELHSNPFFKPDWSPDSFMSRNYIGDFFLIKKSLLFKIGGLDVSLQEGSSYDLLLKAAENTKYIKHLNLVLYHRKRILVNAIGSKNIEKALKNAIDRRGEAAVLEKSSGVAGMFNVNYKLREDAFISIIIPTKNKQDLTKQCIDSIFQNSTYSNFEVVLLDNNSDEQAFFDWVEACKILYKDKFKYKKVTIPFNFSALMNIGVGASLGEYLILLNNDTKIITKDWMERMLGYAQRDSIGVVGVKLLYPNDTIQHAGVAMGSKGAKHILVAEDRYSEIYHNYINITHNYIAATAACVMVRKNLYNEVNGFDESFKVDYNDIDICLRVKEKGYHNVYLPFVELYHYESISRGLSNSNKKSYEGYLKETEIFKSRWQKYLDRDPYFNQDIILFQ